MALRQLTRFMLPALCLISFSLYYLLTSPTASQRQSFLELHNPCYLNERRRRVVGDGPQIFMITPTFPRLERLADMTRLAQSLSHIRYSCNVSLEWIVVEDGVTTKRAVERILQRSGLVYHYLMVETPSKYRTWNMSGNPQRNRGIDWLRAWRKGAGSDGRRAVVYFGDDDNTYDYRLFEAYIAKVDRIGVWEVGLAGNSNVSSVVGPSVDAKGVVTGWDGDIHHTFDDYFLDTAGFAVNLDYVLERK